jgi:hypothetical protein
MFLTACGRAGEWTSTPPAMEQIGQDFEIANCGIVRRKGAAGLPLPTSYVLVQCRKPGDTVYTLTEVHRFFEGVLAQVQDFDGAGLRGRDVSIETVR